jgi:hypothetical protein
MGLFARSAKTILVPVDFTEVEGVSIQEYTKLNRIQYIGVEAKTHEEAVRVAGEALNILIHKDGRGASFSPIKGE